MEQKGGILKAKKSLRWIAIILGILVLAFVGIIIAVVVGSRGAILTGGVPLGGVSFTPGDIPGLPVYPNAVQSTESRGVSVPDDMRRVIGVKEARWKRYLTGDSPEQVLTWYDTAIPQAGFDRALPRESSVMVIAQGDTRYALYVTEVKGQTNILLATGKE